MPDRLRRGAREPVCAVPAPALAKVVGPAVGNARALFGPGRAAMMARLDREAEWLFAWLAARPAGLVFSSFDGHLVERGQRLKQQVEHYPVLSLDIN